MSGVVGRLVSGGQSGVDRAALEFAVANQVPYGGWVPAGGRTEDDCDVLTMFPGLREMSAGSYPERTRENVRDSDVTVVVCPGWVWADSRGTRLTVRYAKEEGRPWFVVSGPETVRLVGWLREQCARVGRPLVVNVAGPRASGWPGGFEAASRVLAAVWAAGAGYSAPV